MSILRLIVGLGNPGREYHGTRHNVGFMIVDALAAKSGAGFQIEKSWQAELARAGDILLCKPRTFMNLSGEAVRAVSDFYKVPPAEMLIALDEMALPFGKLRLRRRGSAGGHNGLQSVIDHLGTEQVPRLRVGIGVADAGGAIGHVLGRFASGEKKQLQMALQRAIEAIEIVRQEGFQSAMNLYNRSTEQ